MHCLISAGHIAVSAMLLQYASLAPLCLNHYATERKSPTSQVETLHATCTLHMSMQHSMAMDGRCDSFE